MNYPHLLLYMTRVSQQCRALGFSENPSSLTKKIMRKGAKYRMLIPTQDLPIGSRYGLFIPGLFI
jgi:hypothetical protein